MTQKWKITFCDIPCRPMKRHRQSHQKGSSSQWTGQDRSHRPDYSCTCTGVHSSYGRRSLAFLFKLLNVCPRGLFWEADWNVTLSPYTHSDTIRPGQRTTRSRTGKFLDVVSSLLALAVCEGIVKWIENARGLTGQRWEPSKGTWRKTILKDNKKEQPASRPGSQPFSFRHSDSTHGNSISMSSVCDEMAM